jgi:hypothetical protein
VRELVDRIVALVGGAACSLFDSDRSLRDSGSTDTDRGSFQGMRERSNRSRPAVAHAGHQQFGLALEELLDFPFEAVVVEGHARKVRTIEHGICGHLTVLFRKFDSGLDHPHLPIALFVSGTLT